MEIRNEGDLVALLRNGGVRSIDEFNRKSEEKFHKLPFDCLCEEWYNNETELLITKKGHLLKVSKSSEVLAHTPDHKFAYYQISCEFKNRTIVFAEPKSKTISETRRKHELSNITAWRGLGEELKKWIRLDQVIPNGSRVSRGRSSVYYKFLAHTFIDSFLVDATLLGLTENQIVIPDIGKNVTVAKLPMFAMTHQDIDYLMKKRLPR